MDYAATLKWLYARLPMYQRVGAAALNPSLARITSLAAHLGNPHLSFKSIHMAGTNGKGSSAHMLASVLQEAGYNVGLYTSPHLKDFRERIRINGIPIAKQKVTDFIKAHAAFFEDEQYSFFEMTVGLAFSYFAEQLVDIAIVEVGLGGRLDATNILTPEACLITNISLDHQQFLGTTRAEIAKEKAGIIKQGVPVVLVEKDSDTYPVFKDIAKDNNTSLHIAKTYTYETDLKGAYQQQNMNGVVTLLHELSQFSVSEEAIELGLKHVVKNTGLRGRWELLGQEPTIIADVAHNKAGLAVVMEQLESFNYKQLHVVFGMVSDKDITDILKLLPKSAQYYLCAADVPRAFSVVTLGKEFAQQKFNHTLYGSVSEALAAAKKVAQKEDVVYVGGSLFVVAEVLP